MSAQKKLDPYVTVKNNHYVLGENAKRVVSEEYNVAKQVIAQTNVTVENSGSVINKDINANCKNKLNTYHNIWQILTIYAGKCGQVRCQSTLLDSCSLRSS
ncbi:hypothetical protein LOB28_09800, partial [Lactobacillus delbrueckii subsp. lactis]|nr:hypothetical protein [Lactobacillus delbrueckii subsp. lactis]MCD5511193.1 hypothetical protein [Lactobacillus delbrueckii subsp. lactis]